MSVIKKTDLGGCYPEELSGTRGEWYYAMDYCYGDLYEAEEIIKSGAHIKGRNFFLMRYPDGEVFRPVPKQEDTYPDSPVYWKGNILFVLADLGASVIKIMRFDCATHETDVMKEISLDEVKDCYNLRIDPEPLTLTRQCVGKNEFEIIFPERVSFAMGDHDSFYMRDGDRLFFSRWHEEGEGADYRYWEETLVRSLDGEVLEVIPGYVMRMPDGDIWNFV